MSALALILLGLLLLVLECILPGGILGVIGYVILMYGIYDSSGGGQSGLLWMLAVSAILAVLALWLINRFPHSWLGRRLTLKKQSKTDEGYVSNDVKVDLLGATGVAHSPLRPAGVASIDGEFVDVVSEGEFIASGTPIVVTKVVGGRTIVKPLQ